MKEYVIELTEDEVMALFYVAGKTKWDDKTPFSNLFESLDIIVLNDFPYSRDIEEEKIFNTVESCGIFKCDCS